MGFISLGKLFGRQYMFSLASNHSHVVVIRGMVVRWFDVYNALLELNGKRHTKNLQLKKTMTHLGIEPKKLSKKQRKQLEKDGLDEVTDVFDESLEDLETLLKYQKKIQKSDLTLIWRHAKELEYLSHRVGRSKLASGIKYSVQHHIWQVISHIAKLVSHFHIVSKSQARGLIDIEEYTFLPARSEVRRIRIQTIAVDHLEKHIKKLKIKFLRLLHAKSVEEMHEMKQAFHVILKKYHTEIHNMEKMMHESKLLIRNTEKLFKAIRAEAKNSGWSVLVKKTEDVEKKLEEVLVSIQSQMRRAEMDLNVMVKRTEPKPIAGTVEEEKPEAASEEHKKVEEKAA